MNSPDSEEVKKNRKEIHEELDQAYRHYHYVRNRNVPLTPAAMDALEFSIQEHMAKFKVEFYSNDERIHITLPKVQDRIACVGYFRITRELQAALDVTKISTYFVIDTARCYKTIIQELKRILLQTQKRHQKCGGLERDIENQQEILSAFELGLNELLGSP
ncbi:hypothetical protein FPANT_14155 [Fusarium pseudoanthophilum]|uniref:Uncharacterized protein n=1 Tax=Fusarium pseudoanthophilum TaxID=48495 RepID=A0A8H5K3R8_9HYPO|nr:hypothetical protein FPANT_14155 [Fusarium pseudoanthophilum]